LFRARAKLVKVMGKYYYKRMEEEEFRQKFPRFCQQQDGVHTEQQLADFLAKEQCLRDPYDQVQYKFIFIPNYTQHESVLVFKCHQCFADGLGLVNVLLNLQDNYTQGQLLQGKSMNILQAVTKQLFSPIEALIVAFKLMTMRKEKNVIHSGRFPQGVKNAAFSLNYPLDPLEKIATDNGMSLNQLIIALFG